MWHGAEPHRSGTLVTPEPKPHPCRSRAPFWRLDAACSTGDTDVMPDEDIPDCCFDEWAARNAKRVRNRETAAAITTVLLSVLDETGLEGRSVLDVGCGTGDLALAALGHGARSVSGFDLGAGAVASARALAQERGLAERATFEVGDGSRASLPNSDVVVLNRVVCCYPSADALLANTLGAAGSVFALTAPIDREIGRASCRGGWRVWGVACAGG